MKAVIAVVLLCLSCGVANAQKPPMDVQCSSVADLGQGAMKSRQDGESEKLFLSWAVNRYHLCKNDFPAGCSPQDMALIAVITGAWMTPKVEGKFVALGIQQDYRKNVYEACMNNNNWTN